MRPIEGLSHAEALWELVQTVNEGHLVARRRLWPLAPAQQQVELECLSPAARRFVVLSIATTRATGLLALARGSNGKQEIRDYAKSIPEPAGRIARAWARQEWGNKRHD